MSWPLGHLRRSITRLLELLVLVLLKVVSPLRHWVSFVIWICDPRYFGHLALEVDVAIHTRKLDEGQRSPRRFHLVSLGRRRDARSSYLWNLRRRQVPCIPSWFASTIVVANSRIARSIVRIEWPKYHKLNHAESTAPSINVDEPMVGRRSEVLSSRFHTDRPYVVVTTKEPSGTTDPLRSRSVMDLLPAIELLCDRGYHVLRVVDSSSDALSVRRTGVVDFHVRRDGKPGDEIALVSGAEFLISTTTGLDALALSLRVPVLYVDAARLWYTFLGTSLATFFPPRYRDIVTDSEIGLSDLLSRGIAVTKDGEAFTRAGVRVEVSSPESIRNYVDSYVSLKLFNRAERILESASPRQANWRLSILRHHKDVISKEHGDIQAVLHPSALDPAVSIYAIDT